MYRSDISAPKPRRQHWRGPTGLSTCGALALCFAAALPAASVQAQFLRSWDWRADEGPPPIPPNDVGQRPASWHAEPPPDVVFSPVPTGPVSLAEIRRRASLAGLRLLGTPHRQGRVFIAFAEDTQGLLHHLAFDAYEGTIVENEITSVKAKTAPAHPAAVTPLTRPVLPAQVTGASPAPEKPTTTAPAVAATDLSPIRPKPGTRPAPTPQDPDIDKD